MPRNVYIDQQLGQIRDDLMKEVVKLLEWNCTQRGSINGMF